MNQVSNLKQIKVKNFRISEPLNPHPPSLKYFQHETVRPLQLKILSLIDYYYDKYDNFFIEAQTGIGKSAIADAIARWRYNDHKESVAIIVNRKQLLQQYQDKYNHFVFMGKNEYDCLAIPKYVDPIGLGKTVSADFGACIYSRSFKCPYDPRRNPQLLESGNEDAICPYYLAKHLAATKPLITVSSLGYLYNLSSIGNRSLLIWDEADSAFEDIVKFMSITLNEEFFFYKYQIRFDIDRISETSYWLSLLPKLQTELQNEIRAVNDTLQNYSMPPKKRIKLEYKLHILNERLNEVKSLLTRFKVNAHNIVPRLANGIPKEELTPSDFLRVEFLPLSLKDLPQYDEFMALLGHKKIFIGATLYPLLLTQQLNLNPERTLSIIIERHPFPPEHRRVIALSIGKMSINNRTATLPKLLRAIEDILYLHSSEPGLILPNSKWLQNEIVSYLLNNTNHRHRVIVHENSQKSINKAIRKWNNSNNGVLISTYLKHGFDGSHGQFVIIPKVPFPSLTDEWIKRRRQTLSYGDLEYRWHAVKDIIQMQGRCTRTPEDTSIIYILDSDFNWLYRQNADMFYDWFKKALTFMSPKALEIMVKNKQATENDNSSQQIQEVSIQPSKKPTKSRIRVQFD